MAVLPLGKLVLYDKFPGPPNPLLGVPANGWDNTVDNCVTAPTYPVGTKIAAYSDNTHNPGWYTMYYGNLASYCAAADVSGDFSDGAFWCSHCCLTASSNDTTYEIAVADGSSQPSSTLATCYTTGGWDGTKGSGIAVPCATLAGYQYGFFWVGGVCPVSDVTLFQGAAGSDAGADVTVGTLTEAGEVFLGWSAATGLLSNADITLITDATGAVDRVLTPIGYVLEVA